MHSTPELELELELELMHGTGTQLSHALVKSRLLYILYRAVSLPQLSAATGVLLQTSASYWTLLPGS